MLTEFFLRGLVWSIVADYSIALTKYSAHIARSAFENLLVVSDVAPKYVVFLLRNQKSPELDFRPKTDYWFGNILCLNFGIVPWITPRWFPPVIPSSLFSYFPAIRYTIVQVASRIAMYVIYKLAQTVVCHRTKRNFSACFPYYG
jgi:hypothetical protein